MAKLRKFCAYRHLKRPYTRISKYRKKSFVRAHPHSVISHFVMGNRTKIFPIRADLVAKCSLQIRHNALESARQVVNRRLQNELGQKSYCFKLLLYPHHILRENKMLSGAHADRLQTGMAHSFGRTVGLAVQAKRGKTLFRVKVLSNGIEHAKKALRLAYPRMPGTYTIDVRKLN